MPQGKGKDSAYWIHRRAVEKTAREYSMDGSRVVTRYGDVWKDGQKLQCNPAKRVTKKALRAAYQTAAEAANARLRAEEAAERRALGASVFKWSGSTAHCEARGTRFLQMFEDLSPNEHRALLPYVKQSGNTVTVRMPPGADGYAKYGMHAALARLEFTDAWKARNAFDAWVEATPEGWGDE